MKEKKKCVYIKNGKHLSTYQMKPLTKNDFFPPIMLVKGSIVCGVCKKHVID